MCEQYGNEDYARFAEPTDNRSRHQREVEAFMRGAGQEIPDKPTVPDEAIRVGRARLLLEECLEAIEALGFEVIVEREKGDIAYLDLDKVIFGSFMNPSLTEIIDGCIDLRVVATGTLSACGIPDTPFQREVDGNNLAKLKGGHLDEHGKFIKPADHPKPDIEGILSRLEEVAFREGERT